MKNFPKTIDLGCGENKVKGAHGVDIVETSSTDQVFDLESEDWPLPKNYFEEVYCNSVLEHMSDPVRFLENVYDIAKDGASVHIVTPHFTSVHVYTDMTHEAGGMSSESIKRYFTDCGDYSYYTDATFVIQEIDIRFEKRKMLFWNHIVEQIANAAPWMYEHTGLSRIFPAAGIEHYLTVDKNDSN